MNLLLWLTIKFKSCLKHKFLNHIWKKPFVLFEYVHHKCFKWSAKGWNWYFISLQRRKNLYTYNSKSLQANGALDTDQTGASQFRHASILYHVPNFIFVVVNYDVILPYCSVFLFHRWITIFSMWISGEKKEYSRVEVFC